MTLWLSTMVLRAMAAVAAKVAAAIPVLISTAMVLGVALSPSDTGVMHGGCPGPDDWFDGRPVAFSVPSGTSFIDEAVGNRWTCLGIWRQTTAAIHLPPIDSGGSHCISATGVQNIPIGRTIRFDDGKRDGCTANGTWQLIAGAADPVRGQVLAVTALLLIAAVWMGIFRRQMVANSGVDRVSVRRPRVVSSRQRELAFTEKRREPSSALTATLKRSEELMITNTLTGQRQSLRIERLVHLNPKLELLSAPSPDGITVIPPGFVRQGLYGELLEVKTGATIQCGIYRVAWSGGAGPAMPLRQTISQRVS